MSGRNFTMWLNIACFGVLISAASWITIWIDYNLSMELHDVSVDICRTVFVASTIAFSLIVGRSSLRSNKLVVARGVLISALPLIVFLICTICANNFGGMGCPD